MTTPLQIGFIPLIDAAALIKLVAKIRPAVKNEAPVTFGPPKSESSTGMPLTPEAMSR